MPYLLLALLSAFIGFALFKPGTAEASTAPAVDESHPDNPFSFFDWKQAVNPEQNVIAFLTLIRAVEPGPEGYQSLVGGGSFSDFADHPANLGWPGIRMSDGRKTTAAGAYQITQTTWNSYRDSWGLKDFSPASQDAFALMILKEKRPGTYEIIMRGGFREALVKLRKEWEAFDRMLNNDYYVSLTQAEAIYVNSGGVIA